MNPSLICIAGGGTGGHVMPALALADAARAHWSHVEVSFIGAERGLEAKLLPERGEEVLLLAMHSIQGAGWLQRIRVLLWQLPCAVWRILMTWRLQRKPQVVVGVGGYASVAGVIAALLVRIPVVLYEQNAIPGLVNRLLYRFCRCMMLGFASAQQHLPQHAQKTVVTGNVIRQAIQDVTYQIPARPCLLVMGGSQGAMFLNQTVPLACVALAEQGLDFSVVHLVGAGDGRVDAVHEVYAQAAIQADVRHYCDDMPALFSQGSLMIARSGAMTVGEVAAVAMPAFFVPLPSAADQHQYYNALSLADVGAAEIIDQQTCTAATLAIQLKNTLFDAEKLQNMAKAAKNHAIVDASARQLQVLQTFVGEVPA
ncbi:MAG: undecaprenyldiphospho-muramoylpentapeptide beta-N-acetylglucosaminyltransferase [Mariprofundaceae bacterium]|nr:undecaprenyldiphospho-muramoylpentapeptide beta-N-acetylglucosaminyltransferase [Mariprofundaceae bacterium]